MFGRSRTPVNLQLERRNMARKKDLRDYGTTLWLMAVQLAQSKSGNITLPLGFFIPIRKIESKNVLGFGIMGDHSQNRRQDRQDESGC